MKGSENRLTWAEILRLRVSFSIVCEASFLSSPAMRPPVGQLVGEDGSNLQHDKSLRLLFQGTFSFEFQPLKAGELCGRLTLHNSDLGYYQYELALKAFPAPPEKPVHFQTVLGSSQSILAKFTNYTRLKTEYYCKVSSL